MTLHSEKKIECHDITKKKRFKYVMTLHSEKKIRRVGHTKKLFSSGCSPLYIDRWLGNNNFAAETLFFENVWTKLYRM